MKALEILKKNIIIKISVEPNYLSEAIKELEELNNRSCESCNYYTGTVCYYHEGWCDEIGVVHPTMEKNDYCNRYEKKDSE